MRHVFLKAALTGLWDLKKVSRVASRLIQRALLVLGFAAALGGIVESTSPSAHAAYALKDALITVGIGAAVGTIIGTSTLPFYSDVGDHVDNIFLGAGAGAAAGLGLALYLLANPGEEDNNTYRRANTSGIPPFDDKAFTSLSYSPNLRQGQKLAQEISPRGVGSRQQPAFSAFSVPRPHEWKLAVHFFRVSF